MNPNGKVKNIINTFMYDFEWFLIIKPLITPAVHLSVYTFGTL